MIAGIEFNIYRDFTHLIKPAGPDCRYEWDYSDALAALNDMVEKFVKQNKLTFLYKNKRVKIALPIEMYHCGNIFGDDDDDEIAHWNAVQIRCEIDCDHDDFKWDKFRLGVCPPNFVEKLHFIQ